MSGASSLIAGSRAPADPGERLNPQQRAAIAARGSTFVSAGAGTGKTTVLVERFAQRGRRGRARRRLAARDHVHRSRRRRASRANPGAPARARTAGSRARPRRRLDLDDPRLLPAAPHRLPAGRRNRSPVPRPRRGAGEVLRERPSTLPSRSSAPPTSPIAGGCSRPMARAAFGRCSSASTTRCALPAANSCSSRERSGTSKPG